MTSNRSMATGSYPMSLQSVDPVTGTTWVDLGEGHKVIIEASAPSIQREQSVINGNVVAHTETREMLTPLVSMPQRTGGTSRVEDMQPIVTTRAYETIRRDVSEVFPGSNIIAVLPPQQAITTPLGGTYTPVTRGFEATAISPHIRTAFPSYQNSSYQNVQTQGMSFAPTSSPTYANPRTTTQYYSSQIPMQTTQAYYTSQDGAAGTYVTSSSPYSPSMSVPVTSINRFPASSPVYSGTLSPSAYNTAGVYPQQRTHM